MLSVNPKDLREEIEDAIAFREQITELTWEHVRNYAGSYYRRDWQPESPDSDLENHAFELVSNLIPNLVYSAPRVNVRPIGGTVDDDSLEAEEVGLNAWIKHVCFEEVLYELAMDLLFDGFAVSSLSLEPFVSTNDGSVVFSEPTPLVPMIRRVSPRRYFVDPYALNESSARFRGQIFVADQDDLLAATGPNGEPVFDHKAVMAMAVDSGLDKIRKGTGGMRMAPDRKEVVGYEVYVPETNMIYTVAFQGTQRDGAEVFIRQPRPWVGSRQGPLRQLTLFNVNDQPIGISPLSVTRGDVDEINAHAGQAREDASSAKRFAGFDSNQKGLGDALARAQSSSLIGIPGLRDGSVQVFEIGGAMPTTVEYLQILRERLDRKSGLTDIQRGNVTGEATATEVALAQSSSNVRLRGMQSRFRAGVSKILGDVLYLMRASEFVAFPVQVPGSDGESVPGVFVGGTQPWQQPVEESMRMVEIEPYSMEITDQVLMQKRAEQVFAMVSQVAPVIPNMPWVRWTNLIDDLLNAHNIPGGADRYLNIDLINMMSGAMLMGPPAPGGEGGPGGPEPSAPAGATQPPQGRGGRGGGVMEAVENPDPVQGSNAIIGRFAGRQAAGG